MYKAGRIDGALGDKLQCWCTLDLAAYFGEAAVSPTKEPAQPPALLMTAAAGGSGSGMQLTASEECEVEEAAAQQQRQSAASEQQHPQQAAAMLTDVSSSGQQHLESPPGPPAPGRLCSRRSLPVPGDGVVLQDSWLPLVDPGDATLVRGRVRVSVRAASVAGMEHQLWRRLLPLADLDGNGALTHDEFAALLEVGGWLAGCVRGWRRWRMPFAPTDPASPPAASARRPSESLWLLASLSLSPFCQTLWHRRWAHL